MVRAVNSGQDALRGQRQVHQPCPARPCHGIGLRGWYGDGAQLTDSLGSIWTRPGASSTNALSSRGMSAEVGSL